MKIPDLPALAAACVLLAGAALPAAAQTPRPERLTVHGTAAVSQPYEGPTTPAVTAHGLLRNGIVANQGAYG